MLHLQDEQIRKYLLKGSFGLEKENLRILPDGSFSHTLHPVTDNVHITRDFCENQIEINTDPYPSAEEAVSALVRHEQDVIRVLKGLPQREYLWPFSNPPYIRNEDDIPIAVFNGIDAWKTSYRKHLSGVYGRYKMTFSGIHVNYSFDEELIRREYELTTGQKIDENDRGKYREFKDTFYVRLTEKMSYCGWLIVALTAASPVIDASFTGGVFDDTINTRTASFRCSSRGYWNFFDPVFDYKDLQRYADSIEKYVEEGSLAASSELYYPVRLKPNSAYSVSTLREEGAGHIELRMFDLNPLVPEGLDVRDVKFAGLLLAYLAACDDLDLTDDDQRHVVRNFKQSARYDLDRIEIIIKGGSSENIRDAAKGFMLCMKDFYSAIAPDDRELQEIIDFEMAKFADDRNRYAYKVLAEYGTEFVRKGLALTKERQG